MELRISKQQRELPRPGVRQMLRLAKLLKLSDEVVLLPRLKALAAGQRDLDRLTRFKSGHPQEDA
jgi:hypothetical protein